jgi:exodeoxyribonuclease V
MKLTETQESAVARIVQSIERGGDLLSISGAAGTGKTTLISALSDIFATNGRVTAVCTPTLKAAQVLRAKGIEASTFYKIFYVLEKHKDRGKPRFVSCQAFAEMNKGGLPPGKKEHVDVLIIDEASMLSGQRLVELRRMCGTLILVGDHNQLPPVGDYKYPLGVFAEMQHTVTLTEVLRQAEGSMILTLATEIRNAGPRVGKMVAHFEPQESFASLVESGIQVIAFTNRERQRINTVVRRILGRDSYAPVPGDMMLVTNNFTEDLVNGTVVELVSLDWDARGYKAQAVLRLDSGALAEAAVNMETFIDDQVEGVGRVLCHGIPATIVPLENDNADYLELTYAYCLTAHKAQGSEWDSVIVIDQRGLIQKIQSNNSGSGMSPEEYVRRWFYTAVTRARTKLYIAPNWFAKVSP